jgi:hypothetical protein
MYRILPITSVPLVTMITVIFFAGTQGDRKKFTEGASLCSSQTARETAMYWGRTIAFKPRLSSAEPERSTCKYADAFSYGGSAAPFAANCTLMVSKEHCLLYHRCQWAADGTSNLCKRRSDPPYWGPKAT